MSLLSTKCDKFDNLQAYQLSEMHRELEKSTNQARFIQMIIDGKLIVSKKKKLVLVQELKEKNFKAFPKASDAMKEGELAPIAENDEEEEADVEVGAAAYDYLLGMPIWSLTKERVEKLLKQVGDKELEIDVLIKLTKEDLWTRDLDDFIGEWRFQLEDEHKRQKKITNMGRRASSKLKIAAGGPGSKKRKNDSDDSDFGGAAPKAKKAAGPKPPKAVGGMLSYLAPEPKKNPPKAKAMSAVAKAAQRTLDLLGPIEKKPAKEEASEPDVWMQLDGPGTDAPKATKPKANVSKKAAPKKKIVSDEDDEEVLSKRAAPKKVESDDDVSDEVVGPTAGRGGRAAAKKPIKYNVMSDSDSDDMDFDVGKMVKGIGNASTDNARPLFTTSSRPSSSAGVPVKKATSSKAAVDIDEFDDTNYSMLAPPTNGKGPAVTARKTMLSDAEEDSFDDILPAPKASKPKPATKAAPKAPPKPKGAIKAPTKKATSQPSAPKVMQLSPAAKAYAAKKAKQDKLALEELSEDEVAAVANEIMDVDEDDEIDVPAARRPARRAASAAPKKKWVISDDEQDDDLDEGETADFEGEDSDD